MVHVCNEKTRCSMKLHKGEVLHILDISAVAKFGWNVNMTCVFSK